jgi:dephospho-CoA kinase
MIKIGLSGNRYSGKKRISKIFKQIGVPVFDADVVLKFILQHNYELQAEISDRVGAKYFKNGVLDYEKVLMDGVFSKILKVVEKDLFTAWDKFQNKNYKSIYCIFHSSILFETEWNKKMKYNISVFAPYSDRVERCKYLTNRSVSSIYALTKTEMDELDKNKSSDFIIHNYNTDSEFYGDALTQVHKLDKKIIDNYLKGKSTTKKEFAL